MVLQVLASVLCFHEYIAILSTSQGLGAVLGFMALVVNKIHTKHRQGKRMDWEWQRENNWTND